MKKVLKYLLVATIILSISAPLFIFTYGCNKNEKKAIILLHGIMGGVLYDDDTDQPVWILDSLDASAPESIMTILNNKDKLLLDENGESDYHIRPATMDDPEGFYTVLGVFEPLYKELIAKYSEEYEIIIWQYDWRLSPEDSAVKLDKYIEKEGYDKVIFAAHSMGGNVVSEYLAKGQEKRDKVELFISVCTPYFGSMQVYDFIYQGLLSNISSFVAGLTKDLGQNLPSVYMLSPSREFINAPEYAGGDPMIMLNGVAKNYDEIKAFYESQDFAKKSDGSLKYSYTHKDGFYERQMVEKDGKTVHISQLVNTHYIMGTGFGTIKTVDINTETNQSTVIEYTDGDCVVSVYSGTAGMPLDAPNVHVFKGPDHITMMSYDVTVNTIMEILSEHFKN